MCGTLNIIYRMDGVTLELLYEVTKIRTNYITVQGKACVCCSAALNQWVRNDKDTETTAEEGESDNMLWRDGQRPYYTSPFQPG